MRIGGCRIQLAGSASADAPEQLVEYAHTLVANLVDALASAGGTFVLGVGREPRMRVEDNNSPAIVFDWTALERAFGLLQAGEVPPAGIRGRLVATVVTEKTDTQIPEDRRHIWDGLIQAGAMRLDYVDSGWTAGAVRRMHQAKLGDLLITLGGGEGVEHLADLYAAAGKPVIPLDLNVGASMNDGSGGSVRLARQARGEPGRFLRIDDPEAAAALLTRIGTRSGQADVNQIVAAVQEVIAALEPPTVFIVRLLNPEVGEYNAVEEFFTEVVEPTITRLGYRSITIGRGMNEFAWMNQAIFDSLHHSAVAVVDLTALRNNCFMEYGYALGQGKLVILAAQQGTRLPFDTYAIDCHMWTDADPVAERIARFEEYWMRNIDRPPLVVRRGRA